MAKHKVVYLLGLLMVWLGLVAPVQAVEAARQSYVVLVGISKYQDPQILPRQHAEADAKALYDVFTNKDYLGVDADHIRLLLGSADDKRNSQPATRANVLKALEWAATRARRDDLVIFAFLGKGAPVGDKACYLVSDSTFKGRAKDGLSPTEVEKALAKLKSEQVCAFIDTYFRGFDTGKQSPPELNTLGLFHDLIGNEDSAGRPASRVLFLAGPPSKPPVDLKDHSLFAKVLIDGLTGKADKDGYEPDGNVTIEELAKYVGKEMVAWLKANGKTEEQKNQWPIIRQAQYTDFVVTANPAVMPVVKKRLAKLAELAKNATINEETFHQGQELLSRMPKLVSRQSLRKTFQALVDGKIEPDEFAKKRAQILAKAKLSPDAAREYARAVITATRMIREQYLKKVDQGDLVVWAIEGLYRRLQENPAPEIKDRLAQAKNLGQKDLLALLRDVRLSLGKREDLANGKDISLTLNPMLGHLDRHTDYTSPETLEQRRIDTTGEYYGIGAHIRQNEKDLLEIVSPIPGSPAYKAPLYAGDVITTIIREVDSDGKPLSAPDTTSTKGLSIDKAVKLIKGKAGTKVKILVERKGEEKPLEFTLTRARVEVETVMGYKRTPQNHWNWYLDTKNKIVYIRLTQFSYKTYRDLAKVMKKLSTKENGVRGLILDLRFNPGGLLDSAVKVSDLFIDDGVIVTVRPRVGQETVYIGKHEGSYLSFPMVCLINGDSASGSEIVAACLQDHHRALIVGERSYGKGSVQTVLPFEPTGGQIKMTNATYWRPSDKNINKSSTPGRDQDEWGVTPDEGFILKMSIKDQDALDLFQHEQELVRKPGTRPVKPDFKDPHLEVALKYLHEQIKTAGKEALSKKAG
jgi:C-terminal peptidase prc